MRDIAITNDAPASSQTTMLATITTNDDMISTYPGGKGHMYQQIINLIPPHQTYIEPFCGGGAVLRHKKPAPANIAIDADAGAIDRLRCSIVTNGGAEDNWRFINTDALNWLKTYRFKGNEFIYADPPYLMSTRRQQRQLYRYELSSAQEHIELLDILLGLRCLVMISGYYSDLYAYRLITWNSVSFEVRTRGGSPATEWLWMNYPPPTRLHDYSYLGQNYRERERIKRKKARWVAKWEKMSILERQAILSALEECEQGGTL